MHKYHKSLHIISNFASKATPVERICEGIEFKHLSSNFGFQFNKVLTKFSAVVSSLAK